MSVSLNNLEDFLCYLEEKRKAERRPLEGHYLPAKSYDPKNFRFCAVCLSEIEYKAFYMKTGFILYRCRKCVSSRCKFIMDTWPYIYNKRNNTVRLDHKSSRIL